MNAENKAWIRTQLELIITTMQKRVDELEVKIREMEERLNESR